MKNGAMYMVGDLLTFVPAGTELVWIVGHLPCGGWLMSHCCLFVLLNKIKGTQSSRGASIEFKLASK